MTAARLPLLVLIAACLAGGLWGLTGVADSLDRGRPVRGIAPRAPQSARPPGSTPEEAGPSLAIFPAQTLTIRFNHRLHVTDLKQPCTSCHPGATTSRAAGDVLLPKPAKCDGCHQTDHRDLNRVTGSADRLSSQCAYCHLGYRAGDGMRVARLVLPRPNLRFNHAVHAARNINCRQCHGEVQSLELATRDQLPRMAGCLRCHGIDSPAARGEAQGACETCHVTTSDGRLQTRFASGSLVPPRWMNNADHDADFIERHKLVAGADSDFCAKCHKESECVDCHDGRVRPRSVHPNDWLSLHAMASRQDEPNCTSCHRQQSFCLSCHQRSGVTMSGPVANFSQRGRFHPPPAIWSQGVRTDRHHAVEAQRNLDACVSCHSERDCTSCHATSALGGRGWDAASGSANGIDPHPAGFRARCRGALRKNARPCLSCHHPADPILDACR